MATRGEELATEAHSKIDVLRAEFDLLRDQFQKLSPSELRERLAVLDEKVAELKRMRDEFEKLTKTVAVQEDRVNKLEKKDEESGKRGWQLLYIVIGAGLALISSLLVQHVLSWAKSPIPTPHT